jgi:hypothetical protein
MGLGCPIIVMALVWLEGLLDQELFDKSCELFVATGPLPLELAIPVVANALMLVNEIDRRPH